MTPHDTVRVDDALQIVLELSGAAIAHVICPEHDQRNRRPRDAVLAFKRLFFGLA